MEDIRSVAHSMKLASSDMAATSQDVRNEALAAMHDALLEHQEEIFAANAQDLQAAKEVNISPAVIGRLRFDEHKLADVCAGISTLIELADPIGRMLLARELDNNLVLTQRSCPIGVIGVIFEARPDAMVQIATLCVKSGNCAILKGGSETTYTNRTLFNIMHEAACKAGLPATCMYQVEARSEISELLSCDESVDLLIPRGSNAFVRYIMDNTRIPVLGHADGICHIYIDKAADPAKVVPLVVDAKTQYVAACNAVETILVHQSIAASIVPPMAAALKQAGVEVRGDEGVCALVSCEEATDTDWDTEYLSLVVSVRIVEDISSAIEHINVHGSHHTDAIITEDDEAATTFMQLVDSAGVYQNASTRFADGFRYGFGAEVGISTSKIHARGPVGLDGLVTYKYELRGAGHIVKDYAEGAKSFHFRDVTGK